MYEQFEDYKKVPGNFYFSFQLSASWAVIRTKSEIDFSHTISMLYRHQLN
jgi:hypothetical protein